DAPDRCHVANKLEIELIVERRVDRVRRSDEEERVAVRRCAYDRLGRDIGVGTGPILDDEGLAETLRQPLTHQARNDISPATGRITDDQAHLPRWVSLCPRGPRYGWEYGSACRQMQ